MIIHKTKPKDMNVARGIFGWREDGYTADERLADINFVNGRRTEIRGG
jgi:hypothetical protein